MFFVLGFTFVFVVFGLLTNASLQLLRARTYDFQIFIARAGGILVIFFGLHVMGLTGWVRNLPDRTVEVVAEGDHATLERFSAFLYRGSSAAQVTQVDLDWRAASGDFQHFAVR